MSLITEDFKPAVNTLEEVKKLQELVRKLEIQNLHLRNKQNVPRKRSISPVKEHKSSLQFSSRSNRKSDSKASFESGYDVENSSRIKDEYFDDLDIIRVSDIEMSDDESWLYSSPKSAKNEHKNESPYKWLRKDVDDPENKQLQLAKKALLTKLNELDILSPPSKLTSNHVENPTVSNLKRTQMYKTPLSAQNNDCVRIDTRTFTRSKKKQAIEFLEKLDYLSSEKTDRNCSVVHLHRRGSDVSSDSVSSCHILEDASDVEEVARLQEESLRMSSPLGTPKRGSLGNNSSCRKISTSSRGSISDQDISESSVLGTPATENSSGYEFPDCNSYAVESLNHSDQSSPSESPYSSNMSLHSSEKIKGKLGGYRRSLPNLNKEPLAVRQSKNNSDCKSMKQNQIKNSSSRKKTDTYLQNTPKTRQEHSSPSRLRHGNHMSVLTTNLQTTRNTESITTVPRSAEATGLRVRSGLPRPSRASSASRSAARSGIPMPSMLSKKQEDSWSEGCF